MRLRSTALARRKCCARDSGSPRGSPGRLHAATARTWWGYIISYMMGAMFGIGAGRKPPGGSLDAGSTPDNLRNGRTENVAGLPAWQRGAVESGDGHSPERTEIRDLKFRFRVSRLDVHRSRSTVQRPRSNVLRSRFSVQLSIPSSEFGISSPTLHVPNSEYRVPSSRFQFHAARWKPQGPSSGFQVPRFDFEFRRDVDKSEKSKDQSQNMGSRVSGNRKVTGCTVNMWKVKGGRIGRIA